MSKNDISDFDHRVDGIDQNSVLLTQVPFRGKILSFSKPNIAAMFLDYSYVLWFTSQNSYIEHKFIKSTDQIDISIHEGLDEFQLFHILEQKMACIIFAYTALEAFANSQIPDDYVYMKNRSDKKCVEQYSKSQIERFISLDTKLGEILPEIMSLASPKGTSSWEKYLSLKKLRDEIIHCKSAPTTQETSQIFKDIFSETVVNPCLEAKDIIGYFLNSLKPSEQPMWFKEFYKVERETPKSFFDWADLSATDK